LWFRNAPRAADLALGGCQDLGNQQVTARSDFGELIAFGLGHEINRPELQGLQGDIGPFLSQSADHQNRDLMDRQEGWQCVKARDLWHLDVERDHVGPESRRLKDCLTTITGGAHDLDFRR
jgi:hypothetical protein